MGRPIGSVNRQKPFANALKVALLSGGGRRLRAIADRLCEKAEQGDLEAIKQVADRLDGRPPQAIEHGNVSAEVLSDRELFAIIRGGSVLDEAAQICGPPPATTWTAHYLGTPSFSKMIQLFQSHKHFRWRRECPSRQLPAMSDYARQAFVYRHNFDFTVWTIPMWSG